MNAQEQINHQRMMNFSKVGYGAWRENHQGETINWLLDHDTLERMEHSSVFTAEGYVDGDLKYTCTISTPFSDEEEIEEVSDFELK